MQFNAGIQHTVKDVANWSCHYHWSVDEHNFESGTTGKNK